MRTDLCLTCCVLLHSQGNPICTVNALMAAYRRYEKREAPRGIYGASPRGIRSCFGKRGARESPFDRASSIENPIETVSSRGRIRYYYVLAIDFIETAKSTSPEHSTLLRKLTRRIEFTNRIGNARTSSPAISFSLRPGIPRRRAHLVIYFVNCTLQIARSDVMS